jgi:hypothetical protein
LQQRHGHDSNATTVRRTNSLSREREYNDFALSAGGPWSVLHSPLQFQSLIWRGKKPRETQRTVFPARSSHLSSLDQGLMWFIVNFHFWFKPYSKVFQAKCARRLRFARLEIRRSKPAGIRWRDSRQGKGRRPFVLRVDRQLRI